MSIRLLFVSTSVGALGTGLGGGVELTLHNALKAMARRGYHVQVIAPKGSQLENVSICQVNGELQLPAQNQAWLDPVIIPDNSVLANMWNHVHHVQDDYDLIVNFSYDWLPLYLTPFLKKPVAHLISMSSLLSTMNRAIEEIINLFPYTVAVHGQTQAATFPFKDKIICVSNGLDISQYHFCDIPDFCLGWAGRIVPEKGLEDALRVAEISGIPLRIFGLRQDECYWKELNEKHPNAPIEYVGFLPTIEFQHQLGHCRTVLITPRWIEAYPNVMLEAMACGVPLIGYRRGGVSEIIQNGKTGWLVEPDDILGLSEAVANVDKIKRSMCRHQAELLYSLDSFGERLESWFSTILARNSNHLY